MSGINGVNQHGGVSNHKTASQSFDKKVSESKASALKGLNRSSIKILPDVKPKLLALTGKKPKFTSLSLRKITHLLPKKFRLLFSKPKREVSLKDFQDIQKRNRRLSKKFELQASRLQELQTALKKPVRKESNNNNSHQLKPVSQKPKSQFSPVRSELRGNVNWTPKDQALENRLKRLKGEVAHDPITASGKPETFEQLNKQLHSISSVDDLKAIVASGRSSKITPDQQRRYLGLLNAAVQGMAKNPQFAEAMSADLIRDVLKEQPVEARAAIKQMHNTQANTLQRRLDRLRKE